MNEQPGYSVWRPITLTDKATGRKVNISIMDREFYLSGFFTFEDLWEMYDETPKPEPGETDDANPEKPSNQAEN